MFCFFKMVWEKLMIDFLFICCSGLVNYICLNLLFLFGDILVLKFYILFKFFIFWCFVFFGNNILGRVIVVGKKIIVVEVEIRIKYFFSDVILWDI